MPEPVGSAAGRAGDAEGIQFRVPCPAGVSPRQVWGNVVCTPAAWSNFCRARPALHHPSTMPEGERGETPTGPAPKHPTGPVGHQHSASCTGSICVFGQREHRKLAEAGKEPCQELILSHSPLEGLSGQERNLERGRGGRGVGTQTRQGYFPCAATKRGRKDTQIDIIEAKCLRFLNQHAPLRAQSKAL